MQEQDILISKYITDSSNTHLSCGRRIFGEEYRSTLWPDQPSQSLLVSHGSIYSIYLWSLGPDIRLQPDIDAPFSIRQRAAPCPRQADIRSG